MEVVVVFAPRGKKGKVSVTVEVVVVKVGTNTLATKCTEVSNMTGNSVQYASAMNSCLSLAVKVSSFSFSSSSRRNTAHKSRVSISNSN